MCNNIQYIKRNKQTIKKVLESKVVAPKWISSIRKCFIIPAYFPHIGRLNQLLVLSQQLDEDVKHLGSHKYIAHQLSAIYVSLFDLIVIHIISMWSVHHSYHLFLVQQVLNSLKDVLPLSIIRKDIEANFKQLKMSLSMEDGSKLDPQLQAHHVSWWEWF